MKRTGSTATSTILTLLVSITIASILLLLSGGFEAFYYFFLGPISNTYNLGNTLASTSLLILTGLSISLAFQAGVFNLGGEGQIYTGAIIAVWFCTTFPMMGRSTGILSALFLGSFGAALLSALSALLKTRLQIDVLISTFLVSGASIPVINNLINTSLNKPESYLTATVTIPENYFLHRFLYPSSFNSMVFPALILALGLYLFFYFTATGYELRMSGKNREFARYGGLHIDFHFILPLIFSGGINGFTGSLYVLGIDHQLIRGATFGLGWNGIAVALIARNHPLAVIPSAIIFTWLTQGARAAELHSNFPFELGPIIQGLVFLLITTKFLYKRKQKSKRRVL